MLKVLITGGFGCVGGRLAQQLTHTGKWQVVLGTRRLVRAPDWLPTAVVVETRWQSDEALRSVCAGMDAVVHLAGMNALDCAADPVEALDFNGLGTARLLRAAAAERVRRFVHVSTAHVYGSPLQGCITEHSATAALHPYATSHRAGEDAVLYMQQRRAIQGIVMRMSNSFGPPAHERANCWMLLVNDLCRQAIDTGQMVLQSAGTQRRDFITLTDACRVMAHLLDIESGLLGDGLFNVGGAWAPTVIEMTERIAARCHDVCGFQPRVIRPSVVAGDVGPDIDYRIDRLLRTGFELLADVDSEIVKTLKFCSSLSAGKSPP